jgi:hypothetical protein
MNKRIKELAEQAMEETSMFFADRIDRVHRSEFMELYNEKFAELIINECTSVCDEVQEQHITYTAATIKQRIKDKFGVE